ncbi:unnamed protein product [Rodentolepis nana]|uniref:Uncharacterized protein n=1 Tax=Rodentolepis nana TaxID=102285 RepID=A0A0R3U022_RODNA|nr:unnamed protein product [Rodentolepis nana]
MGLCTLNSKYQLQIIAEIEDMLSINPLELIYSNEDPATYLHYSGTRITPDLLLASSDISEHELHTSTLNFNQHPHKLCNDITNIMIRCAK